VESRITFVHFLALHDNFGVLSGVSILLRLGQTSMKATTINNARTPTQPVANYLRFYRLRSGLSQRELAELSGLIADHQVSTHERSVAIPSLLVALSYQAVFAVPVAELFPGIHQTILVGVEERLSQFEQSLHNSSGKGRAAQVVARKLEWLCERRSVNFANSPG